MIMYCDPQDTSKYVSNLKIMPLSTNDLRCIVEEKIPYSKLYKHFCEAHDSQEMHPQKWYDDYVNIENSNLSYMINEQSLQMAAEPFEIYNWNRFDKNIIDFFGGDKTILVGCYKDKKYLDWIQTHNLYNIRLGNTKGSMEENRALFKKTTLLLLYELNKPGKLSAYEICGHQKIVKDELLRMDYPNPKPRKSYMGFTIKPLDMDLSFVANQHLVEKLIKVSPNNAKGTPVFIEP